MTANVCSLEDLRGLQKQGFRSTTNASREAPQGRLRRVNAAAKASRGQVDPSFVGSKVKSSGQGCFLGDLYVIVPNALDKYEVVDGDDATKTKRYTRQTLIVAIKGKGGEVWSNPTALEGMKTRIVVGATVKPSAAVAEHAS